jgi:predicted  nucleic acid-binding Zn-ribbon protein
LVVEHASFLEIFSWTILERIIVSLDYGLLRTLHRMLRQLTDIGERMEKGPRKVRIVTANEANFSESLDQAKAALLNLRKASNAKQMQLGEREAKIEDLKTKLNSCDSNKEFQLLKDRIAADTQANSVLQDEILEQLEKLDVLTEEVDAAKENYAKSQAESKRVGDEVELELKALDAEKTRIEQELGEKEKLIPADLVVQYRRLVAGKGEDALGLTNSETCGNCNQTLTTQTASDLMMQKPVFCKGCGCWMYLAENHAAGLQ